MDEQEAEHKKLSQCRCMKNHGKCSCGWSGDGINKHVESMNQTSSTPSER